MINYLLLKFFIKIQKKKKNKSKNTLTFNYFFKKNSFVVFLNIR